MPIHIGLFEDIKNMSLKNTIKSITSVIISEWYLINDDEVKISKYGFHNKDYFLKNQFDSFSNDEWILCPIQSNSTGWDVQIGVTGKCKKGKEPSEAILIEIQEELGLKYIGSLEPVGQLNRSGVIERTVFKIHVWQFCLLEKDLNIHSEINTEDDNNKKVAVLVHGSLEDIERIIDKSKTTRYYLSNNDNIIGIAILSVKTIKNMIDLSKFSD